MISDNDTVREILLHQLRGLWIDVDSKAIDRALPAAVAAVSRNYWGMADKRVWDGERVLFSPYVSTQWANFLYRLSSCIYRMQGERDSADQIYYLNKVLHGVDWFYAIDLPAHFHCEHPLGSVLGRADYGDYLFVYQGTTVGGNWSNGTINYPSLGDNVVLYSNATILGASHVGSNVLVSSGTYLLNETIPNNSIVFGKSPDIIIKRKTADEIQQYTQHIWGW